MAIYNGETKVAGRGTSTLSGLGVTATATELNYVDGVTSAIQTQFSNMWSLIYPIGAIYTSVVSTSPATLFGGTWSAIAAGRVLVGLDSGDTDFDTVEETGGAKTHTLTDAEMPSHNHRTNYNTTSGGLANGVVMANNSNASNTHNTSTWWVSTTTAGSDNAHANVQPYLVVYMWKRTA